MKNIELTELERKKLADAGRQSIACTHGWRPIDTAPKDDTEILLVCLLYFSDGTSDRMITSGQKCFTHPHDEPNMYWVNGITLPATHWMPLPKLPEETK